MSRAGAIEWAYTPRTSRALRVLTYVPLAALGGLVLLAICLVASLAVDALLTGDLGQLAIAVGLLFAGSFVVVRGPGAIWLLPDERERLASELDLPPRRRPLLVASAIGAAVLFVAVSVEFWIGTAIFLGGMGMLVVVSALHSEGAIDPEELTLEYDARDVSLAALNDVRAARTGSLAVCWLSFERGGVGARSPRLVVLPTDAYERARPVFERAIDHPSESGRTAPFAERMIFLVFGVGLLAVGPILWAVVPAGSDATIVLSLLGAMTGVFGLLLVWLAAVS